MIDWTNASRGLALTDVALTIILVTCPVMPGSRALNIAARPLRAWIARAFAARYKGRELDEQLVFGAELKALDAHMSAQEVEAMTRLGARAQARLND